MAERSIGLEPLRRPEPLSRERSVEVEAKPPRVNRDRHNGDISRGALVEQDETPKKEETTMADSDVFLPLRLAQWGHFKVNSVRLPQGVVAESIDVEGSEGGDVFAIEDGTIERDGSASFTLDSEEEDHTWVYSSVSLTVKEGEVKAGQKIGKVQADKPLRLSVKDDDAVVVFKKGDSGFEAALRAAGFLASGDVFNPGLFNSDVSVEIPQNPLPVLKDLQVKVLPADQGAVTSESDEPDELTDLGFNGAGKDNTLRNVALAGGGLLVLALAWKALK